MNTTTPLRNSLPWKSHLEAAINESGKSKREVSLAAGLGANYIQQIFKDGKEPSVTNLLAIAAALNKSVSELTGEPERAA